MINEAKKTYIKPEATIIEIPNGMNLSDVNLEDLIKFAKPDNEENIITPEN